VAVGSNWLIAKMAPKKEGVERSPTQGGDCERESLVSVDRNLRMKSMRPLTPRRSAEDFGARHQRWAI
jgi:hypothetical protein